MKRQLTRLFKKNINNYEKSMYKQDKKVIEMAKADVNDYEEYYNELSTAWNELQTITKEENVLEVIRLLDNPPNTKANWEGCFKTIINNAGVKKSFENCWMPVIGLKEYGWIKESNLLHFQLEEVNKKMQLFLGEIYDETVNKIYVKTREYYIYVKDEVNRLITNAVAEPKSNIEEIEQVKLTKITEKEKMQKFMQSEGYSVERYNGDHAIYKNKDGHMVPVPVRDIGSGLGYSIQKQVYKI